MMNTPIPESKVEFSTARIPPASKQIPINAMPPVQRTALTRAAEVQQIQERQMLLLQAQHVLAAGLFDLQAGAQTAMNLSPLLEKLLPDDGNITRRHLDAILAGRADAFRTITEFQIFVEDVQ